MRKVVQFGRGLGTVERGLLLHQVRKRGRRPGFPPRARRLVRDSEPAFVVAVADESVFRQRAVGPIRGVTLGALAPGKSEKASLALLP